VMWLPLPLREEWGPGLGADVASPTKKLELAHHVPADLVLWAPYALNGQIQDPLGPALVQLPGHFVFWPAGVAGINADSSFAATCCR